MKILKCNLCLEQTQNKINREPNNDYDQFLCTECYVTLAYAQKNWNTKKLYWQPNLEFEKQLGICIATIVEWR